MDPSGLVVDGNHADAPISGATVTLLAGTQSFSPFTAVPNGSTVMSPANRKNSDTTNSIGEFGWDTLPGWYEVEAHKAGCGSTTTPAFQVPPPVTNLQLVLHCSPVLIETASLPTAKREVHYETQLLAGGEDPPFKWEKEGGAAERPQTQRQNRRPVGNHEAQEGQTRYLRGRGRSQGRRQTHHDHDPATEGALRNRHYHGGRGGAPAVGPVGVMLGA